MIELDYDYLAALAKKALQHDSDAFAELYAATYKKQYRFTYQYVKDPYLAQDILQDLYIHVLKNLHTLKNPRLFVSWLNQINFRLCFDACQKELRYNQQHELKEYVSIYSHDSTLSPEEEWEKKSRRTELMGHILSLPPKEAQIIILKFYNDMTIDEIAEAADCSKSTVKRRLASGKLHLEKLLRSNEGGMNFE